MVFLLVFLADLHPEFFSSKRFFLMWCSFLVGSVVSPEFLQTFLVCKNSFPSSFFVRLLCFLCICLIYLCVYPCVCVLVCMSMCMSSLVCVFMCIRMYGEYVEYVVYVYLSGSVLG